MFCNNLYHYLPWFHKWDNFLNPCCSYAKNCRCNLFLSLLCVTPGNKKRHNYRSREKRLFPYKYCVYFITCCLVFSVFSQGDVNYRIYLLASRKFDLIHDFIKRSFKINSSAHRILGICIQMATIWIINSLGKIRGCSTNNVVIFWVLWVHTLNV